jgi:hypothetical protein
MPEFSSQRKKRLESQGTRETMMPGTPGNLVNVPHECKQQCSVFSEIIIRVQKASNTLGGFSLY